MSLIMFSGTGSSLVDLHCIQCGAWVGCEEIEIVADMSKRGVEAICFDCGHDGREYPAQLYLAEDTFLLGIGELSFLCSWGQDQVKLTGTELSLRPITAAAYYSLQTGDVRMTTLGKSLSSSPKLITMDLEGEGINE